MTQLHSTSVPVEVLESVKSVLGAIDVELQRVADEDGAPAIRNHLELLNANLRKHPELVHLLPEEDIAPYYKAMMKQADLLLQPIKKKAKEKTEKQEAKAFVQDNLDNLFGGF
jgi:hypothetical protein